MLHRDPLPDGRTRLTFILPAHDPAGEVSVVGTFNDWQPGTHHLVPTEDGTRSVSVIVEAGMHHFRYLATGGVWADEFDADSVTAAGSIIDCPAVPVRVEGIEAPSKPARASTAAKKTTTKSPAKKTPAKKSATKKSTAKAAATAEATKVPRVKVAVATSAATTSSAKTSTTASTKPSSKPSTSRRTSATKDPD